MSYDVFDDVDSDDLEFVAGQLERAAYISGQYALSKAYTKISDLVAEARETAKTHAKEVSESYKEGKQEGMGDGAFEELEDLKAENTKLQDMISMLKQELRTIQSFLASSDSKLMESRKIISSRLQNFLIRMK